MRGRNAGYQIAAWTLLIAWSCSVAMFIFLVPATVVGIAQRGAYERSQETQHHGIRVVAVADNRPCLDGCGPSTPIPLALSHPVDGRRTATLSPVHWHPMTATVTVTVLLDPRDPGYAELPGQPTHGAGSLLVPAIVAWPSLAALVALLTWLMKWRRRLSNREIWRDLTG